MFLFSEEPLDKGVFKKKLSSFYYWHFAMHKPIKNLANSQIAKFLRIGPMLTHLE